MKDAGRDAAGIPVTESTAQGADVQRRPRSHAERSNATRQAVLDAALRVLNTNGYTGATIAAIREEAGVSTGALNHQFPSKAQLMAAVVERFCEQQIAALENAQNNNMTPRETIEAIMTTTDAIIHLPEMAASFEIHLARRNDPDLDALTRPIYERFDRRIRQWLGAALDAAGVSGRKSLEDFMLLNFAVYRGLGMELSAATHVRDVSGALTLWRNLAMQFYFSSTDMTPDKPAAPAPS